MDKIVKQVVRARRLLFLQIALGVLPWCLLVAFSVCFAGLLIPKLWYLPYTFDSWSRIWLGGSLALALLATTAIAWFRRPSFQASAVELDRRFGLRERISSALGLGLEERETAIGAALLDDATTRVERIDVRDQFPLRPTSLLPWVLLPIVSCAALFWVPDAELPSGKQIGANQQERLNNVKAQTKPILEQVKRIRKDLEDKGLEETAEEFKKIQEKLEQIQKSETLDSKKLLSDFNDIKKEMEKRKESLGSSDSLKKALENMKKIDKGPADKIADALKEGEFKQAEKELEKLLDQLRSDKLTKEQKSQLASQLKQMEKAIEKAVQEQKDALEDLKQELKRAEQSGDLEKVAQVRKKMEQVEKALAKVGKSEKMQEQMKKAAEAMEKGDKQAAQEALEEMQAELSDMAADMEDLQELQDMMDEMQDAKQSSNCKACSGKGCEECNGAGKSKSEKSKRSKNAKGDGRGEGEREEEESDTQQFESQVRDQMKKGETVNAGKVGGQNRKGTTKEETKNSILSATPDDPEAIENIALPKAQRDQLKEYFDLLRTKK